MVRWTDYMLYRIRLRGFEPERIEEILRFSNERYIDSATGRRIAVGRHTSTLIMVPYEVKDEQFVPVTVHATSRVQINTRVKTGRFRHE